jgi:RND family efflux transporter MFP subunit
MNARESEINLMRKVLVFLLLLSGAVLAQQDDQPANVRVALAAIQPMSPTTLVPGTVVSRDDAKLAAEVAGRLLTVAEVGTVVAAGEPIAHIDDTTLKLHNAELSAEITRARARVSFLEREEQRFTTLAESNLTAVTQLELTRSDRDVARGDLAVARARLAQNEEQIARTRIAAPFDGVVVARLMMPGERVDVGSDVVRLVDQQNLEVIARAPLTFYAHVHPGLVLTLSAGTRQVPGMVRTVVAVGDENTHQFEMRIDLDGAPFPVGQTLRVGVPMSGMRNVLAVPRDALVLRPDGVTVFVVDANDTAKQISVTTGVGSGDQIEIIGALAAGDRVVVRGNERLRTGQSVSIAGS